MNPDPLFEIESEKAFLASLLLKGATGGTELGVIAEDFYHDLHRRMFASIVELIDQNTPIDPISVTN